MGYGVSCKRISRAGEEEDCNKDPSAALGMTMRKRSLPIPFYSAARANLRPFGAPPSIGRRESRVPAPKPFPRGKEAIREYRFLRTVISSASEKSFSFAVKQCMRVNKNGKPDIPRMWDTVFHVNGSAELVRKRIATKIPRLRSG